MVQWLRLRTPNAGGPGLIPGQGTVNRPHVPQVQTPQATTKSWCSQINEINVFLRKKKWATKPGEDKEET